MIYVARTQSSHTLVCDALLGQCLLHFVQDHDMQSDIDVSASCHVDLTFQSPITFSTLGFGDRRK